jgi:hypothetical protein
MGLMILGAAAAASAQNAGPPGPPPGMGGPPDMSGGPPPGLEQILPDPGERDKMWSLAQRAMAMRTLDDPEVRAEIGMSPEQEKKFLDLKDQAMSLGKKMQEEMQAKFANRNMANMTPEERLAARQEMMQSIGQAIRDASTSMEAMVADGENILTPAQKVKLASATRASQEDATGGLSVLLTQQGRDACDLTGDHVAQIRIMIDRLKADWKDLRDKTFGPDKVLTPEELKSDKYKEFKAAHAEMVTKTRDKILTIFAGDHRDKVQKFLASRVNRPAAGGMRGMGGMRGGPAGAPGVAPTGTASKATDTASPPAPAATKTAPATPAAASPWSSN